MARLHGMMSAAEADPIRFSVTDGLARITLNRPERLNAVDPAAIRWRKRPGLRAIASLPVAPGTGWAREAGVAHVGNAGLQPQSSKIGGP